VSDDAIHVRNAAGLSDEQVALLRGRLQEVREELRERLAGQASVQRETEPFVEALDAAEQTREQDDAITFAARDRQRLREIDWALAKIASGRYGLSEVSGEPIAFERLLVVPWARQDSDEDAADTEVPSP
jgi:RNA polymerase-binding transcription factor